MGKDWSVDPCKHFTLAGGPGRVLSRTLDSSGGELPSTARALRCVIPLTLVRIACPKQLLRRQSQVGSGQALLARPAP